MMRAVLIACVAALFAGCSAVPVEPPAAPPPDQAAPAAKPKIEQAGFSTIRRFEICTGNDCSKRTEKIIDVPESPPVPPPAVVEAAEALPPIKEAVPVPVAPPAPIPSVAFAGNHAMPSKEGLAAIKSLLPAAKSARKVVVRGYTDADGSAKGKRLALRRANAVRGLLVKGGVKANVVVVEKIVGAEPKNNGCAANQHVTIELINKE